MGLIMPKQRQRMPVMIRGVQYKDAHTAAEALGVSLATVYDAISRA